MTGLTGLPVCFVFGSRQGSFDVFGKPVKNTLAKVYSKLEIQGKGELKKLQI